MEHSMAKLDRVVMSHDTMTGVSQVYHRDNADGMVTITQEQEVAPIIEHNKAEFNDAPQRWNLNGFNKIASLPLTVYYDLKAKGILDDEAAFKRWLNDSENRHFRTRPGAL
jgi:hypothetical protein